MPVFGLYLVPQRTVGGGAGARQPGQATGHGAAPETVAGHAAGCEGGADGR